MMKIEFLPKQNNPIYIQADRRGKIWNLSCPKGHEFSDFPNKTVCYCFNFSFTKKQREEVQNNKIFLHKQVHFIPIK
jgi:hypothetical protein